MQASSSATPTPAATAARATTVVTPSAAPALQAGRAAPAPSVRLPHPNPSLPASAAVGSARASQEALSPSLQPRTAAVCPTPARTEAPVWAVETLSPASAGMAGRAVPAHTVSWRGFRWGRPVGPAYLHAAPHPFFPLPGRPAPPPVYLTQPRSEACPAPVPDLQCPSSP